MGLIGILRGFKDFGFRLVGLGLRCRVQGEGPPWARGGRVGEVGGWPREQGRFARNASVF